LPRPEDITIMDIKKQKAAKFKPNMMITGVLAVVMLIALGVFINSIMKYNEIIRKKSRSRTALRAVRKRSERSSMNTKHRWTTNT
jgi:hypothetical protein